MTHGAGALDTQVEHTEESRRTEQPRARRLAALVLKPGFVLGLAIAVSCAFALREVRRLYFFGDDWAFLLGRDLSWDGLMRPHNEHWSTLPVIAFRTMVAIFGINHYSAYALMPLILHAAFCVLLYVLLRRHGIGAWPAALVVIPFSFLSGRIGENPLWDFQIGFLGSGVFGLLSIVMASRDGRRGVALSWLSSVVAFMCSGIAIPMLAWLGMYLLFRHGLRRALIGTVPPALVYGLWWLGFGRFADAKLPDGTPEGYVEFVSTGLGNLWEQVLRVPASGALALFVLLAVSWLTHLRKEQRALALSGVLAAAGLYLLIGVNRAGLGPEAATVGRYAYFALAMTVPAAAVSCELIATRLSGRQTERALAGLTVAVLLVGNGVAQTIVQVDHRGRQIGPLAGQLRATRDLIASDARFLNQQPAPTYNPDITIPAVTRAWRAGELPAKPASPQRLLDTAASLQIAASSTSFSLPSATAGFHTSELDKVSTWGGCTQYRAGSFAYIDLPRTESGSQLIVETAQPRLIAQLVEGERASTKVQLAATTGTRRYVGTTSTQAELRLFLPPGSVTICLGV